MNLNAKCVFEYEYLFQNNNCSVKHPIILPIVDQFSDIVNDIIRKYSIPLKHIKNLSNKLQKFILDETIKISQISFKNIDIYGQNIDELVNSWDDGSIKEKYHNPIKDDEVIFAEAFSYLIETPHLDTLLRIENDHHLALTQLLTDRDVEMNFLKSKHKNIMDNALATSNETINAFTPTDYEEYVTSLANQTNEEFHVAECRWASKIHCLKAIQCKELREWVMNVYEHAILTSEEQKYGTDNPQKIRNDRMEQYYLPTSSSIIQNTTNIKDNEPAKASFSLGPSKSLSLVLPSPNSRIGKLLKGTSLFLPNLVVNRGENLHKSHSLDIEPLTSGSHLIENEFGNLNLSLADNNNALLEESFTVNLGCQLKTMYNLRLIRCDLIHYFCGGTLHSSIKSENGNCNKNMNDHVPSEISTVNSQKLLTLLTLYSDKLHGLVVIEDGRLDVKDNGSLQRLNEICEKDTEYHFKNLDVQLDAVRRDYNMLKTSNAANGQTFTKQSNSTFSLDDGTVYITKHSTLSRTHILFHICLPNSSEQSWISHGHDTNVRCHAALFDSLRSIIRCAFGYFGVQDLVIPLLLATETNEKTILPWCLKRAELVFKCVKGYVIETQSFSNNSQLLDIASPTLKNFPFAYNNHNQNDRCKTIQFQLPAGLSQKAFERIREMLPNIFRLPTPIR